MKYHGRLEIWKMRDGSTVARMIHPLNGEATFYDVRGARYADIYLLQKVRSERGKQLEIEYEHAEIRAVQESLFPETLE